MSYSTKEPKLSSKTPKDKSAYSESAGAGKAAVRSAGKLDKSGGVAKKDESQYKEGCKDE